MENIQNLQRGEPTVIASEPYCVVVAGDCAELNSSEKKASFERFRERLNGVRILTFDEVYKRIDRRDFLRLESARSDGHNRRGYR
jgi:Domain of unknown function (DUF4263)